MTKEPLVSIQRTQRFGLLRKITGKVSSRVTWVRAKQENRINEEKRRCREFLDAEFARIISDKSQDRVTEFDILLPEEKE